MTKLEMSMSGQQFEREIHWMVMLNIQADIESLTFTDIIPAGLFFNGIVTVADLNGNTIAHDLNISEEKDAYTITFIPPFVADDYHINFVTEIASHYFDESFKSTFSNTGFVTFGYLDEKREQITLAEQSLTTVVPFESRVLSKIGIYNPITREIMWTVTVNPFNVNVASGIITEDLTFETNYPTTYIPESFATTSSHEEVSLGEVSEDLKILFINVGEIGKSTHTFTFKVKLDTLET